MSELTNHGIAAERARQRRLRFPPSPPALTGVWRLAYVLAGLLLFPFYLLAGAMLGVPGLRFRGTCLVAGIRLLFAGHAVDAYRCIVAPLDSVRHFEMDFFWKRARALQPERILDVSSPRLLPLMLLRTYPHVRADLINPDTKDLARTRTMARGLGVDNRCHFLGVRIDALPADARDYPLVTCMSVLEHIVDDLAAIRTMWDRVAPGGHLLLSVPCAAQLMEEFTNVDEYGLLDTDADGFVFWQRYYDETRLQAIFAITGVPVARALYAERVCGAYDADVLAKRTKSFYPNWREPFATARTYVRRDNIATLPGMGVVALEFAKPMSDQ